MANTSRRPRVAASKAMDRAQHHGKPERLSHDADAVLEDVLREATDVAESIEDSLRAFGRYLLAKVFGNDSRAALDNRADNPVWNDLLRRAGGPSLRLSRKTLEVAMRMAAYDRRINDEVFRGLDIGRKERLLPLGDEKLMREAAQHVTKFHLTHAATEEYVTAVMLEHGRRKQVRFSVPSLVAKATRLRTSLASDATLHRIQELRARMKPAERQAMAAEMDELATAVKRVAGLLRKRGG